MADKSLTLDQFRTLRKDNWWVEPLLVVVVLGGFAIYATWAALENANYYAAPYLSPFYSPCISGQLHPCHPAAHRFLVESVAGLLDSLGARRLSRNLLLLSQGLLPIVFPITAGLRRARRREEL